MGVPKPPPRGDPRLPTRQGGPRPCRRLALSGLALGDLAPPSRTCHPQSLGPRLSGCGRPLSPAPRRSGVPSPAARAPWTRPTHVHVVHVLVTMPSLLHVGAQGGDGGRALLEGWKARRGSFVSGGEQAGQRGCSQQDSGRTTWPASSRGAETHSEAQTPDAAHAGWSWTGGGPMGGYGVQGTQQPFTQGPEAGPAPACRRRRCPSRAGPAHRACWPRRSWPRSRSGPAAPGSGPRRLCGLGQDRRRCDPRRIGGPAPARCGRHSRGRELRAPPAHPGCSGVPRLLRGARAAPGCPALPRPGPCSGSPWGQGGPRLPQAS